MTFNEVCHEWKVSPTERVKLCRYLAFIRLCKTLDLLEAQS